MEFFGVLSNISFKPYYKWNTFNTSGVAIASSIVNLSFKPYYKWNTFNTYKKIKTVCYKREKCFKPYYKWNTFNTKTQISKLGLGKVLNLIINGIPSILNNII